MNRIVGTSIAIALLLTGASVPANAAVKPTAIKLDYTKAGSNSLQCPGVTIPITYEIVPAMAPGAKVNVTLYNKGKYEQTLNFKADANGTIRNMNMGGQVWYGTTGGNSMPYQYYLSPVKSDPSEACTQLKSFIDWVKAQKNSKTYVPYKAIAALFFLGSK